MIKVIIFLVKIIASAISTIALFTLIILALIMWNEKFMELASDVQDEIWRKN